jgi:hypothetical protein
MSEIQKYSPDWDAYEGHAFLAEDSLGSAMKFSDLAPYVEARVKEAVEKEREVLNRENGNLRRIVGEQSVRHRMKLEERDYTIARLKALVDAHMKVLNSQAPQLIVIQEAAVRAAQEKGL